VIFSGVILVLTGLSFQVARRTTRSTDQALIMAELQSRLDQASVAPFDSLPGLAGCDSTWQARATIHSCLGVVASGPTTYDVTVTVFTSVPGTDTTSLTFVRAKPRRPIPLR
jgi:hypothetical protein